MEIIGITGGTGLVGSHLSDLLLKKGYKVVIFSRGVKKSPQKMNLSYARWDAERSECETQALASLDAVVHLAGAGIADKRWTTKRKKEIRDSRVSGTRFLVSQLKLYAPACKTFVAASAIGYYGPDNLSCASFKEDAPACDDFLGTSCALWEKESREAADFLRTVIFRFSIVLAKDKGAFPKFLQLVQMGAVPILGSGRQVISWIHVGDLCNIILSAIENKNMEGVFNAVSPYPVTNEEMMKTITKAKGGMRIPFHVPSFILKLMLGEMSTEVLKSCTVSADKILQTGFPFQYPVVEMAVENLIR